MTVVYQRIQRELGARSRRWLVTGAAGFIGSHLVETLLRLDQSVIGLDNFATGSRSNLDEIREAVGERGWSRFTLFEADICDLVACREAVAGATYVLHQAALGSVPRSIDDPLSFNAANVEGFLNILVAAKDAGVERFVYAASSSTYGDDATLPKVEAHIGSPNSPYAVTKLVNELYADVFRRCYNFPSIGLRYFNVFGPRQNPNGAYAAVIPKWVTAMIGGEAVTVHGDGETTRDFCYIDNAVQANLLAAFAAPEAQGEVYNVAVNARISLNHLFDRLRAVLATYQVHYDRQPIYGPFRLGDLRDSQADISKAMRLLGYTPTHSLEAGLEATMPWYLSGARRR